MREIRELLPTEALLLLDIKKTTGLQLIIKTIEELILMGVIKIENDELDGKRLRIIKVKNLNNSLLKDYHDPVVQSIREHYNAYHEITEQNALTLDKLVGYVRVKLNFSYNRYKFRLIYSRLELWNLVKSKFPFYYFNRSLTERGVQMRNQLNELLERLKKEMSLNGKKENLFELKEKLGLNVLLLAGSFEHMERLKMGGHKYFNNLELEIDNSILQWAILDNVNAELPELEFPDLPEID